jgi:adenylate cyclase
MKLLEELKRRNVFRVGIAYAAIAWLLIQVAETVLPVFGIPNDVIRIILIVLAIGFLPSLVVAWAYEMTPGGIKRDSEVDRNTPLAGRRVRRIDQVIMIVLGVAIAYFAVDKFVLDPAEDAARLEKALAEGAAAGRAEALRTEIPDNTIAVLPFINRSNDADNEYFSDGVSEELLNLLSRAQGIVVASRTSSFFFKGKDVAIPEIAERLNVRHVLEGSVRKSVNTIRVTAQLVDTRSDTQLWSNSYNRVLDDIFAVQEEIAQSIVDELRVKLGNDQPIGQPQGLSQTANVDAYQLYLRGISLLRLRGIDNLRRAAELFEEAIEIDPEYARAYAQLAATYALIPFYSTEPRLQWLGRAEETAKKSIELDPTYASPHATLAVVYQSTDGAMLEEADKEFHLAIKLDPNFVTARQWYGEFLMTFGRSRAFLTQLQVAHKLDPLAPVVNASLAWAYFYVGDYEQSERFAFTAIELGMGGTWAEDVLGLVYIQNRQFEKALAIFGGEHPDFELNRLVVKAIMDPALVPQALAAIEANEEFRISYWPVELILLLGETDLALDQTLESIAQGDVDIRALWRPRFLAVANDSRFKEAISELGLPKYWDATEWADACRKEGDDFSCDAAYVAER